MRNHFKCYLVCTYTTTEPETVSDWQSWHRTQCAERCALGGRWTHWWSLAVTLCILLTTHDDCWGFPSGSNSSRNCGNFLAWNGPWLGFMDSWPIPRGSVTIRASLQSKDSFLFKYFPDLPTQMSLPSVIHVGGLGIGKFMSMNHSLVK